MISVLITIYNKEQPENFDLAMESIYNQTLKDFEVVLVADGPLTDGLYKVLNKWENLFGTRLKTIYLKENRGLASALNAGLKYCSFDLVTRMDSDDYSVPERLKMQYDFMKIHPEVDVTGSYIDEFLNDKDTIDFVKEVPIDHRDITNKMWFRNPINHVTVMFRKKTVIEVKGYDPQYGDDNYLWAKMYVAGKKFYNMPISLVKVRVGNEMYRRRGGIKLFLQDFKVRKYLFENGKMNFFQFVFVILAFFFFRITPSLIRRILYFKIRKTPKNNKSGR